MQALPFHPLINTWFSETFAGPTPVQKEAWPLINKGEHVLALAPTGSGKTLTGFLGAISRFAEGTYDAGKLSVLYVSPLKALNEDIRRNLLLPLEGIRAHFEKAEAPFPAIRVETRSGDTPQSERRRFLSMPPSILALTPESLGIILLNPRGRQVLSSVRYVILDEIHAALGSKRGCFLSCQIDRLALVAGEFQRVALSATVKPPEAAAEFAGGLGRKIHIVSPDAKKEIQFEVLFPEENEKGEEHRYGPRYTELIKFISERIKARKEKLSSSDGQTGTILVFTDSRRRAERISFLLNRAAEDDPDFTSDPAFIGRIAYCHHGSLSKEVRREVEKALAAAEIPCVVATGSLELGLDIGSVEEVILAGSPGSAAVALQRVGRSGHSVGMTSRGWLIPFHGLDLLQAAAIAGAVEDRELEETTSIENPLDLLAQIILALCTEKDWHEDELYETIRGFYVYRNLSRISYDGVLRMLAGAYEATRLRELKRQIFRDEETKILSAAPGALILLYTSGGVITSKGHYSLRLAPGSEGAGTKIGELDEEFVWERRLGDCFDFGNRSWRITAIGDEAVEVIPLAQGADSTPFWKGEEVFRSPNLSRRILTVLEGYYPKGWTSLKAEKMLENFSGEAKKALEDFLHSQWSSQKGSSHEKIHDEFSHGCPLPGPSFIPVEIIDDAEGRGDAYIVVFHSFKGGAVNFPLSLALAQDIETRYGLRVEGTGSDNAVFLRLPRSITEAPSTLVLESLRRLSSNGLGDERFRQRLEASGIFGAAFREAAERSMILPRSPYGKRMPLWVTRQKSKRLFDAVSPYRDFPVTAEAWRSCLREQFDMEGFNSFLEDFQSGALSIDFFYTRKMSPFAKALGWAETNVLMYESEERPDLLGPPSKNEIGPSLSDQVINEALGNASARPSLKTELVNDFCLRLRREIPGWAPEDALSFCEWVKERVLIPCDEWEKLLSCIPSDLAQALKEDKSLGGKLEYINLHTKAQRHEENNSAFESQLCASVPLCDKISSIVLHRDWAKKWKEAEAEGSKAKFAAECLLQWMRYQGPVSVSKIAVVFNLSFQEAEAAAFALSEQEELILDVVVEKEQGLVCDRENLELLLRMGRRKQRPQIKERPAQVLIPFLARRQGLLTGAPEKSTGNIPGNFPWRTLNGFAAPAKLWETEFFPSRSVSYTAEMLDREIQEGRLIWYGAGLEKAGFCRPNDLDLVLPFSQVPFSQKTSLKLPLNFFDIPRSFWEIKDALDLNSNGFSAEIDDYVQALWEEVWRGSLSADSWEPVRRRIVTKALKAGLTSGGLRAVEPGVELNGFPAGLSASASGLRGGRTARVPRAIRDRWRAGPPVRGNWFSLALDGTEQELGSFTPGIVNPWVFNPLEEEELNRDRVRLLLGRWGVLSRPLLEREAPLLSWSQLLPAMRRMELAGELVTGRFFAGINSLQFASPLIAEELEEAEAERGIFWMNAADPASPAGLAALQAVLCSELSLRRLPSTRLCFRGTELLVISNRGGKELDIIIPADDPDIVDALAFIKLPRTRMVQPESKVIVEKINGKSAGASAYRSVLEELGFVKDRGKMVLW